MPALMAALSIFCRASGGTRTAMTDVLGVPILDALVLMGDARRDQSGCRAAGGDDRIQMERRSGLHPRRFSVYGLP